MPSILEAGGSPSPCALESHAPRRGFAVPGPSGSTEGSSREQARWTEPEAGQDLSLARRSSKPRSSGRDRTTIPASKKADQRSSQGGHGAQSEKDYEVCDKNERYIHAQNHVKRYAGFCGHGGSPFHGLECSRVSLLGFATEMPLPRNEPKNDPLRGMNPEPAVFAFLFPWTLSFHPPPTSMVRTAWTN